MSDVEMKLEVEAEEFTEDLGDEALEREGARLCLCDGCAFWRLTGNRPAASSACAGARQGACLVVER